MTNIFALGRSFSIKSLQPAGCILLFNLRDGEKINEVQTYIHKNYVCICTYSETVENVPIMSENDFIRLQSVVSFLRGYLPAFVDFLIGITYLPYYL